MTLLYNSLKNKYEDNEHMLKREKKKMLVPLNRYFRMTVDFTNWDI